MNKNACIGLLTIALIVSASLNTVQFWISLQPKAEEEQYGFAVIHGWVTDALTNKAIDDAVVLVFPSEKSTIGWQIYYNASTDYKGFYTLQVSYFEKHHWIYAIVMKDGYFVSTPRFHEINVFKVRGFNAEWNFTMWEKAEFRA